MRGNLGNRTKTFKGASFSHFGGSFCRHDFQARSSECFVDDFSYFGCFPVVYLGSVLEQMRMEMEVEKRVQKELGKGSAGKMRKRGLGPVSP